MAKYRFSKGTWLIRQPNADSRKLSIETADNPGMIYIDPCDHGDGLAEHISEEDQANARLVVAAPELYAIVAEIARRDPVFAKGYHKIEITNARALIAVIDGDKA